MYELTEKGEKYLDSLRERISSRYWVLKSRNRMPDPNWWELRRRELILRSIHTGKNPFEHIKSGNLRSEKSIRKSLERMTKSGLISKYEGTISVPGWEQKIQVDLGMRHPGNVTVSQEEYEMKGPH